MKTSELLNKWNEARTKLLGDYRQELSATNRNAAFVTHSSLLVIIKDVFDSGFEAAIKILDAN